jgi:imidazoleglycerol phosphate synthase cyclase subunit
VRARLGIPLTVGGGVRVLDDARALLEAGADKVSVNTAAVQEPALLAAIAERFGRQCTVLAIDAAWREGRFEVLVKGGREGTGIDAIVWAHEAAVQGAGEILLTSWDRDGTRSGYDLDLIRTVREAVQVPVIASGGAAGPEHLREAFEAGADAVLAASIFHDGDLSVTEVKRILIAQGIPLRP